MSSSEIGSDSMGCYSGISDISDDSLRAVRLSLWEEASSSDEIVGGGGTTAGEVACSESALVREVSGSLI
jgi:hypothetical protein